MARKTSRATTPLRKKDGLTKMEAVRRAVAELGKDAMPVRIQQFVKDRFGVEMTTAHISVCKGSILRERSGKGKKAPVKPAAPAVATKKASPRSLVQRSAAAETPAPSGDAVTLEDVRTVKELLGRIGTRNVRQLVDVLGR
jgi:hypothetical protein